MKLLDCTLRDGGYYNAWNFDPELVNEYLEAMEAAGVDMVELGLRSLKNSGFKGACAYTTDDYLCSLPIPARLTVGVMVNASELVGLESMTTALETLFPASASDSPVDLVRIACHVHEFEEALDAVSWLKDKGYLVGFNLMQVADRSEAEIKALAKVASGYELDALYFADSMGSMSPDQASDIIGWLRSEWKGELGIHTHDNLGLALSNTLRALDDGVTWVDATVTGMGRGPGNSRTEELAIEIAQRRGTPLNIVPLMTIIRKYFKPMQQHYGWGTNPYYYLSGKYGIHPTYIQEMLSDARFSEEDVLAVIEHLRKEGGKKFSFDTLDTARHFYNGEASGGWSPSSVFEGREVLLIGTGPGIKSHKVAIERHIKINKPLVLALNTQSDIDASLIDIRIACHPVRLLADCDQHAKLPHPLITPYSMLPDDVKSSLSSKEIYDFGLNVKANTFVFNEHSCTVPTSLVVAYALAVINSGKASSVSMVGFDGYGADDPRNVEMNALFHTYVESGDVVPLTSLTPTRYSLPAKSIYGL
ncbi:aldolase catalytic domain-containing protein [Idiomarina aquatica]|uniref:Aldolase n=1 Tax=Idiomarina aquatica TaxID=1327752 RepID=A0AA94JEU9_9GAMM|nr:aldolase catalytic domain-containing protein [Idiomarina aquatica]RUO45196.1 aldolase [Idiomarina aquatica]